MSVMVVTAALPVIRAVGKAGTSLARWRAMHYVVYTRCGLVLTLRVVTKGLLAGPLCLPTIVSGHAVACLHRHVRTGLLEMMTLA